MSRDKSRADDFKLISYKKPKKSSQKIQAQQNTILDPLPAPSGSTILTVLQRLKEAKAELQASALFESVLASLREGFTILGNPKIKEIVCFGLGRIGECLISKYQFALLLCLQDLWGVQVKVFDPIFTDFDTWLLEAFKCERLTHNCEGKWRVTDKETTLFYLPHCSKQLTNNLLWANWGLNLNYCIIIANSFTAIVENTPKKLLNHQGEFITNISPHVVELAIINSFKFFEIFNDTAIHIFPWLNLGILSNDFWHFSQEPHYSDDDVEFIKEQSKAVNF